MSSHPTTRSDKRDLQKGRGGEDPKPTAENPKPRTQNSKLCFVCVGAGRGLRFGGEKLAQPVGDRTVFASALRALTTAIPAAPLIVVVAPEEIEAWRERLTPQFPQARFIGGGARRQDSVRAGVQAAADLGAEVVAIHDAARPLVDPRDVQGVVAGLGEADGAILTARVSDTIKRVDHDGMVVDTLDRETLHFALTPQVFRVAALEAAWRAAGIGSEWTDESALLESAGMRVVSVIARCPNPKVTTDADLGVIRALADTAR
jgi:2-C-methyl-D-erythritol 4-phosphate cytidylyltransferase/2-C-methyl-D-erythritol 2,4-cyclodiphosphate synthase